MKNYNPQTKKHPEWLTPPEIITSLGMFDLDPCTPSVRPWDTAKKHYCKDGLENKWEDRVWLNPPYGTETFKWVEKLADHGNGIALIYSRTDTRGFHTHVLNKATGLFFFKGRLKFHYVDGTKAESATAPSCLVAYGENNYQSIVDSGLVGRLIRL